MDGVKPLWEDPACKDGGRWTIRTPKSHTAKFWEDLLLAMVGDQLDAPRGEILGAVLSLKFNNDTISIWHRNAKDEEINKKLKASLESHLEMTDDMRLEHEVFSEVVNAPPKEKTQRQDKTAGDDTNASSNHNQFSASRGRGRGRGRGAHGGDQDGAGFKTSGRSKRKTNKSMETDDL